MHMSLLAASRLEQPAGAKPVTAADSPSRVAGCPGSGTCTAKPVRIKCGGRRKTGRSIPVDQIYEGPLDLSSCGDSCPALEPVTNALDFYESLEGNLVRVKVRAMQRLFNSMSYQMQVDGHPLQAGASGWVSAAEPCWRCDEHGRALSHACSCLSRHAVECECLRVAECAGDRYQQLWRLLHSTL